MFPSGDFRCTLRASNNTNTDINIQALEVERNTKNKCHVSAPFSACVGQSRITVSTPSSPTVHTWQDAEALLPTAAWTRLDYSGCSTVHLHRTQGNIWNILSLCSSLLIGFILSHSPFASFHNVDMSTFLFVWVRL